jgi:hypothetical protein
MGIMFRRRAHFLHAVVQMATWATKHLKTSVAVAMAVMVTTVRTV